MWSEITFTYVDYKRAVILQRLISASQNKGLLARVLTWLMTSLQCLHLFQGCLLESFTQRWALRCFNDES